jgi:nucleotide-binding universal stress UspA family protein
MDVRRILCPIDFSEPSAHAIEHATCLARWFGARLAVLHVRPTVTPHPDMPPAGPMAPWLVTELEELRQRVAAASNEATAAGVDTEPLATAGAPVHEILRCAATVAADLIVMGTHGLSGFQHLVLGSVTERVLRTAPCPVLTVPPRAAAAAARYTRVLCAVDFSDCSIDAAAFAASLAREAGAALSLVHVIEWPWHEASPAELPGVPAAQAQAMADYRRYLESGAKERLDAVAASAAPAGTVATSIRVGRPYVELLEAARDERADLVVLGVRGRGALDLGFFGSTANHLVRSAQCPVLTIRDGRARAPAAIGSGA